MQEAFSAQVYSILVIKVKMQFFAAAKETVNNNSFSTCLPGMSAMPPAHVSPASRACQPCLPRMSALPPALVSPAFRACQPPASRARQPLPPCAL